MQNRNIEERLQILNDYIQRTIDALNATRQVAAQTLGSQMGPTGGLSHTQYGWNQGWQQGWQQPQFVQTPQGLMPVNPYFTSVHPMAQMGLQHSGFVPGFVPNVVPTNVMGNVGYGVHGVHGLHHQAQWPTYGYGLQHSTMVPQWHNQWQNVSPWANVPVGFVPVSHVGVQNQPVMGGQTTI